MRLSHNRTNHQPPQEDIRTSVTPDRTAKYPFISIHMKRREAPSFIVPSWTCNAGMSDNCGGAHCYQILKYLVQSLGLNQKRVQKNTQKTLRIFLIHMFFDSTLINAG